MKFDYSLDNIGAIAEALSFERFQGYLARASGDQCRAIQLYEKNTALSEALYGVVQGLEIPLRNAINRRLASSFGDSWYIAPGRFLNHPQNKMVDEAVKSIQKHAKHLTPGRVVAELSFGFWTGLIGKQYEQSLWVPYLYRAFPHATVINNGRMTKLKRAQIAERLDGIRKLRNRIAHHEPILDFDLQEKYNETIEAIRWICPVTATWIAATTSFRSSRTQ